jgi:hypothetical protein
MSVQIVNEVDRVDDAENNALADYHSVNVFMIWAFLHSGLTRGHDKNHETKKKLLFSTNLANFKTV